MNSLLLVDSDKEASRAYATALREERFSCTECDSAAEVAALELTGAYDLLIMEMNLPDMNGFDFLASLRSQSQIPIVVLSSRPDSIDKIVALEMGADDYLCKPILERELIARVRSILRRSRTNYVGSVSRSRTYMFDGVEIDTSARLVRRNGVSLGLTQVEYGILEMLIDAAGQTVPRELISLKALGKELAPYDRSIDVHISKLRKKLGDVSDRMERIVTVRGIGYFYSMPSEEKKAE
ncbi:response regulator transcription factor [Halodesulfovibrio aestuarii]|uniref:response regulator transcription factor n=1 Tax=Halodesulfovibrio aestuarii TaxID=126333 RepID=UPI00040D9C87